MHVKVGLLVTVLSKLRAGHCRVEVKGQTQKSDPLDVTLLHQGDLGQTADPSVPLLSHL